MAKPVSLQSSYDLGIYRDKDRHMLPKGAVWNLVDYLMAHGPPLRGRGAWLAASPDLSESGSSTSVPAVAYAPFTAGGQLVAIGSNSSLWKVDSDVSATDKGNATVPAQRPVFFKNLLIVPGADGATTPFKYDGSAAPSALGGSPPQGVLADVYKSRLLLARSSAELRRIWFSGPGDPEVWDTADGYLDVSRPVTGLAALRNAILVYSTSGTERIRGNTPPPSREMELEPLFEQGCVDPASIVRMGDQVIWANAEGVWQSDGAILDNLTERCSAGKFWRDLMQSYSSSWTISAGEIFGLYFVSVLQGGTTAETMAFDIDRKTWFRVSNLPTKMFAERIGSSPELYFGHCGASGVRVGSMANFWTNSYSVDSDAFGTGPSSTLETVYFRGSPGSRRIRNLYLGVDLSAADQNTYLTLGLVRAPGDETYDTVTDDAGATFKIFPTDGYERVKIPLKFKGDGFGLRVSITGPADEVMLYDIEAEIAEQEPSK